MTRDGDFLLSGYNGAPSAGTAMMLRCVRFDAKGNQVSDWYEYIGEMNNNDIASPCRANGKIYLLSHGYAIPTREQEDDDDFVMTSRVTTLKEIVIDR